MTGRRRVRAVADGSVTAGGVARGVLLNVVSMLVLGAGGFLMTGFLVRHIGASSFGAWVLVSSVLAYSSILDFGVGLTVNRFVAEVAHLPDRRQANVIVSTAIAVFTAVGGVVLITGIALAPWLADSFGVAGPEHDAFVTAFRITAVALALTFPSAVWTAVLFGLQQFAQLNFWVITQALGVMAAQITVVALGHGIVAMAWAGAAGAVVLYLGKRSAARRHGIRTSPRLCELATLRRIVGVSSWVFLLNVALRLILDTDAVLIGAMFGTAAVASYQVALGPATTVRRVADQFNSVSLAAASSLKAQDELARLRELLTEATRVIACVFLPCLALLAAWGEQLLTLWVGPEFRGSYATLVVLTVAVLGIALQGTAAQILLALDRHRLMALIAGAEAACNLALSIVLARRLGIVGVAWGTALPTLVTSLCITLPYTCRLVGAPYRALARRIVVPALVAGASYAGMTIAQAELGTFSGLPALGVASALVLGAGFAVSLMSDARARGAYTSILRARPRAARRPARA